ncbi:MAG: hypothetical protein D6705_14970 [Deltaproteobacteria bacterium]|nr:MAG: hypothetical protein D6705_14970 [Deltaproteobacteria bacterium]
MTQPPDRTPDESVRPYTVARRLACLPEPAMRAAVLTDLLRALPREDAAWLLDTLATAGRAGGPPFDVALMAAVDAVEQDRLDREVRWEIFAAARRMGLSAAMELLSSTPSEHRDVDAAAPRPLVPGTRPLTLGERKALARTWRQDVIERLLVDPHVDVVRLLLQNPHVTEDAVLRIATNRRASSEVLEAVLAARRFSARPRVRLALVRNPNLPVATALRLLGLLRHTDLRELAKDPSLPAPVASAVRRRLRPRT